MGVHTYFVVQWRIVIILSDQFCKFCIMAANRGLQNSSHGKQTNSSIDFDFFADDGDESSSPKAAISSASPKHRSAKAPSNQSFSSRGSDSENERSVVRIQANVPQVERTSDVYDDNFDSDDELTGRKSKPPTSEKVQDMTFSTANNFSDDGDVDNSSRAVDC